MLVLSLTQIWKQGSVKLHQIKNKRARPKGLLSDLICKPFQMGGVEADKLYPHRMWISIEE